MAKKASTQNVAMEVKNESSIQRAERFAQVLEGDQD
jgi:hypothetical protein